MHVFGILRYTLMAPVPDGVSYTLRKSGCFSPSQHNRLWWWHVQRSHTNAHSYTEFIDTQRIHSHTQNTPRNCPCKVPEPTIKSHSTERTSGQSNAWKNNHTPTQCDCTALPPPPPHTVCAHRKRGIIYYICNGLCFKEHCIMSIDSKMSLIAYSVPLTDMCTNLQLPAGPRDQGER